MKTFKIEYEVPPLRAIYQCECEADTQNEAVYQFGKQIHIGRIRKINGVRFNGDMGQRYKVVADFSDGEKVVGYTNDPTGGKLLEGAMKWPACKNAKVIDRQKI